MSIPTIHDMHIEARHAHEVLNGSFNNFPPKWREITAKEFAESRHFTFQPVLVEYRQMIDRSLATQPARAATLHWQADGTGFAVVNHYYEGTIKFYAFGNRTPGLVENFDTSDCHTHS